MKVWPLNGARNRAVCTKGSLWEGAVSQRLTEGERPGFCAAATWKALGFDQRSLPQSALRPAPSQREPWMVRIRPSLPITLDGTAREDTILPYKGASIQSTKNTVPFCFGDSVFACFRSTAPREGPLPARCLPDCVRSRPWWFRWRSGRFPSGICLPGCRPGRLR